MAKPLTEAELKVIDDWKKKLAKVENNLRLQYKQNNKFISDEKLKYMAREIVGPPRGGEQWK